MKNLFMQSFGAILLALFLLGPRSTIAGRSIDLMDLPAAVTEAIYKRFSTGELLDAEVNKKNDKILFEVNICHQLKIYEVSATKQGKILHIQPLGVCA